MRVRVEARQKGRENEIVRELEKEGKFCKLEPGRGRERQRARVSKRGKKNAKGKEKRESKRGKRVKYGKVE